jgi:hypothetical protein
MDRTKLILGKLDRRLRSLKVDPFPRPDELLVLLNEVDLR